jgi:Ran GTPase-activating protein (RanGAP) involved in mRNA processing and transport
LKKQKLTDKQLAEWIAKQAEEPGLVSLDLRENQLTHVGVEALAKAKIGVATSLMLSQNPIGDRGAKAIAAGTERFHGLEILYLKDCKISAVGARALMDPKTGLKGLWEIELSDNPIGDAGVEAIAKNGHTSMLSGLYLSNVGMTDRGARALAASPHLGKLKSLYVDGNKLTPAGIQALKESPGFPKCTPYFGEKKDGAE